MPRLTWILLSLLLALAPIPAFAWGTAGQKAITAIAEAEMSRAAKRGAGELLIRLGFGNIVDASGWADSLSKRRPETAAWHQVNIPLDQATYDRLRDCPGGNCVVARVEEFARIIADPSFDQLVRAEALGYLLGLVSDLHQPVNAVEAKAQIGHEMIVEGSAKPESLQLLWDDTLVQQCMDRERGTFVAILYGQGRLISESLSDGTPIGWVNEAHKLAVDLIYGDLGAVKVVDANYVSAACPVVRQQIQRAGFRLAAMLNKALVDSYASPLDNSN